MEAVLNGNPDKAKVQEIDQKVLDLNRQIGELGVFKGKEKKVLQMQVDALTAERAEYAGRWGTVKRQHDEQIQGITDRIAAINAEFTKDRDSEVKREPKKTITIYADGSYVATPTQVAEYMRDVAPGDVTVFGEGNSLLENYSKNLLTRANMLLANGTADVSSWDKPETLKMFHINYKLNGSDLNACVAIFGTMVDVPMQGSVTFELDKEVKDPEKVAAFARIVTEAVLGICPSVKLPEFSIDVVSAAYGLKSKTESTFGGFTIIVEGCTKAATSVTLKPIE